MRVSSASGSSSGRSTGGTAGIEPKVGSGGSISGSKGRLTKADSRSRSRMDGMLDSEMASGGSRSSKRRADSVSLTLPSSTAESSAGSRGAPSLKQKSTVSSYVD